MSATARRGALDARAGLPTPDDLVATSTEVPATAWPEAVIGRAADRGLLVSGRSRLCAAFGAAASLRLPRGLEDPQALVALGEWLGRVECVGATPGVVALGAFPFDRGSPASLVVPAVTWCRDAEGRAWRVDVRRRSADGGVRGAAGPDEGSAGSTGPTSGALRAHEHSPVDPSALDQIPPGAGYADAVARAVEAIRGGDLQKIVLARMVEMRLPRTPAASDLLQTLWGGEAIFSPFSVPTASGRLVGASPELIVARQGQAVLSHALGGTVPIDEDGGDTAAGRLLASAKDRAEHRLVVEQIVDALAARCASLSVPDEPTVVRLRSDARLGTLIRGTLGADYEKGDTALALLGLLHPTPAVGGVPRPVALERIAALEAAPRGFWAGAVGWTDAEGDGEWVLAIRSVELEDRRARVRAGAGIVADSDPQAELAETTVKLRPVVDALWPGASALL